jgi:hypothetical protein
VWSCVSDILSSGPLRKPAFESGSSCSCTPKRCLTKSKPHSSVLYWCFMEARISEHLGRMSIGAHPG